MNIKTVLFNLKPNNFSKKKRYIFLEKFYQLKKRKEEKYSHDRFQSNNLLRLVKSLNLDAPRRLFT